MPGGAGDRCEVVAAVEQVVAAVEEAATLELAPESSFREPTHGACRPLPSSVIRRIADGVAQHILHRPAEPCGPRA